MTTSQYIIDKFIEYFKGKGHILHSSAPLAPTETSTTMFNIAGMQQFINIFLGQKPIEHSRVITVQPCLRTNDLENVGKTARHHSFFHMLGNFSFGDYFKEEAILMAWEFLTQELKVSPEFMYFTVHEKDEESMEIWNKILQNKTVKINTNDNFWKSGKFGPCGYCSEIFIDTQQEKNLDLKFVQQEILNGSSRFLEIWNIVFIEYNETAQGLEKLSKRFIDTGMGLERITSVLDGSFHNYKTDCILPIVQEIDKDLNNIIASNIVADHLKSIVTLVGEGLSISNS